MINLMPLYRMPSSHVISSLKYQYDYTVRTVSDCFGHPSCTVSASSHSAGSFAVALCISHSLSGLADAICVVWWTGIFSMLFRLVLQSWGSGCRGATLDNASTMTLSLPQRYSMCTSYWASLRSSLCSLGLKVAIVFFHMLVSGWWSVFTVIDFPNV